MSSPCLCVEHARNNNNARQILPEKRKYENAPVAGKSPLGRPDSPELSHLDRFCPQRAQNLRQAQEKKRVERTVVSCSARAESGDINCPHAIKLGCSVLTMQHASTTIVSKCPLPAPKICQAYGSSCRIQTSRSRHAQHANQRVHRAEKNTARGQKSSSTMLVYFRRPTPYLQRFRAYLVRKKAERIACSYSNIVRQSNARIR